MHFMVDTVSEYTYFQNMLLGLADALHKRVGVKGTYLRKLIPLTHSEISLWEQIQGVMLPEDLRAFYSSSNGYIFEWTYTFGDNSPEETVVCKIEINSLEGLKRVYGYETTNDPGINTKGEHYILRLAPESQIFELMLLPERGKVVLVYLYSNYAPSIWLLTTTMDFYYLADGIATYLRMAIVHLGIPNWQLAYTPQGVPQWTEIMFRMLIPHLLPLHSSVEKMIRKRRHRKDDYYPEVPLNKFDPNLFHLLPRPDEPVQLPLPLPPELEKPKQAKKKPLPAQLQMKPIKYKRKPLYYLKKR